ncbi:hypothetical protein [Pyrodictium abyssi]|uniref:Uncharacterized protein n=1 Tax=Pyrodictium abyssi TaxID=54256 RepID=A0ABM8IV60_9CREN|nr:hypothetical protein PABY_10160 [Pyrodictium abyssi]
MPATARYNNHILIVGPGLDEVLEPGQRILLLDEFYADVYGDYVFLGYDVVAETIDTKRADYVGLYTAAVLLDSEPSVIVCGVSPDQCLLALAAHRVYRSGEEPSKAVEEAATLLEQLYGKMPRPRIQGLAGLTGLYAALRATGGASQLSPIMALALNYEYGRGRLHYGEAVSWLALIGASHTTILAGLLHFLVEGPGSPHELLERRLSTVGEDNLIALLGERGKEALEVLRDYIDRMEHEDSRTLALIEALGPGEPYILHVDRQDGELRVYCRTGEHGEPDKDCVAAIERASKLLPLKRTGIDNIRISTRLD